MAQTDLAHRHLKRLLDAASLVSIISGDIDGIITLFNPGAERMLGYSADEMVGKQTPAIIHLPEEVIERGAELSDEYGRPIEGFEVFVIKALENGYEEREWTYVRKDGSQIQVNLGVTPIRDRHGVLTGFLGVATDITQRVKAEKAAILAKAAADKANAAKTQFLSTMSHEIRTPLNGILGIASHLSETDLDDTQQKYVQTILHSGGVLQSILNNILDLGKIEEDHMTLEEADFDLQELVESVVETARHSIDEDKVELQMECQDLDYRYFIGDQLRVSQVLWNLVSNAIKFTPAGKIIVSLSSQKEKGTDQREILLSVRDSGIGIAADKLDKIFEPFIQEDNSISRKYGGTGLGLSIVRKLVDLMDGELLIKSEPDVGSCFRIKISLPPSMAYQHPQKQTLKPPLNFNQLHILVAEDNLINAKVIETYLDKLGCHHQLVATGCQAFESVLENHFDLILMDIQMPEMDGLTATKMIRAHEGQAASNCKDIPIIALTAEAFEEQRQDIKMAGLNDVLTKPYTKEQLVSTLQRYV